jgi:hypothetical protein
MEAFCYRKKKAQKAQAPHSSQGTSGYSSRGSEKSSASSETQELFMLLRHLAASTMLGVVGSVTHPYTIIGSTTTSQSSTLGPRSPPSSGTYPCYLDLGASFYMTPHSAHRSSLGPYPHYTIHTTDGS